MNSKKVSIRVSREFLEDVLGVDIEGLKNRLDAFKYRGVRCEDLIYEPKTDSFLFSGYGVEDERV